MINEKLKSFKIILGSKSPRRKELLESLGIEFVVKSKDVEETFPNHLKREEIPIYLSRLKASAFTELGENEILITSDTIVWSKNRQLGKPKNKKEAITMLKELSSNSHDVISGVTLKSAEKEVSFYEVTKVYFDHLSDSLIEHYIDNYEPYDKAGSYGIQDWIGKVAIKGIEGDYYNVMGLPLNALLKKISEVFSES